MSPITKSMISRPVALELPGMVGSFAYPAPAKQSPAQGSLPQPPGFFQVYPYLKMLDWHRYLINVEQPQLFATAKGLDLTKIRRARYDSKSLHATWVARR
ncbi:hypothetical protein FIBSPDRAFT_1045709 [Athelia psychrophila]|uniref:Uncharacterized protein n=1 Tax=Athelia psychrophila TaxID=1759441 RepID=A0A166HR12_9AGAM|nr:hypothetical protein FIBSPDRAFT_1045709 [Fibularhizoctonia sp. CBS 109695]